MSITLTESAQRVLRDQVEAMATICDALSVGVYVADLQTHELLFVNRYLERTFGADWAGRPCYKVLQAGQDAPCTFCTNTRLIRDGVVQPPYTWEFQNTVDRRWYLCIDRAVPWIDGRVVRLEVAVDITERKELERLREQYLGLVSHDLRSPLAAILTTAEVLQREMAGRDRDAEALAVRVSRNAERMKSMLDDLTESVRLESQYFTLDLAELDLGPFARSVVDLLPAGDRARVELRIPPRSHRIVGDRQRLERVLDNLLSNALKYGPADTPCVVQVDGTAGEVVLSVIDAGTPIAKEHRARLFDRFYRVPGTPGNGLGLGLFIARLIVERHGGRIDVDSTPDQGNRFTIALPRS